ncbi:hypothetical protein DTO006G1_8977 [Penicillium roqueforti]|nr:hypothetical protein DTO006G1_8977 [Penicillium roqueforti]
MFPIAYIVPNFRAGLDSRAGLPYLGWLNLKYYEIAANYVSELVADSRAILLSFGHINLKYHEIAANYTSDYVTSHIIFL